jgi:hypothetical protein
MPNDPISPAPHRLPLRLLRSTLVVALLAAVALGYSSFFYEFRVFSKDSWSYWRGWPEAELVDDTTSAWIPADWHAGFSITNVAVWFLLVGSVIFVADLLRRRTWGSSQGLMARLLAACAIVLFLFRDAPRFLLHTSGVNWQAWLVVVNFFVAGVCLILTTLTFLCRLGHLVGRKSASLFRTPPTRAGR